MPEEAVMMMEESRDMRRWRYAFERGRPAGATADARSSLAATAGREQPRTVVAAAAGRLSAIRRCLGTPGNRCRLDHIGGSWRQKLAGGAAVKEESALDGMALLASMTPARRAALARRCAWRTHAAGEEILARDEPADAILFITEGRVRVVDFSASGREVAYAVVGAGGHVGELGVIDGAPRSASVMALDRCRVASLPAAAFWELVETESGVAKALLRRLARIIRDNDEKITELATMGAMQRVYRELLRLARPLPGCPDDRRVIDDLPTQETLASRLGTTRETVARVLAHLARTGITKRQSRRLTIHRPTDLELLAGGDGDA